MSNIVTCCYCSSPWRYNWCKCERSINQNSVIRGILCTTPNNNSTWVHSQNVKCLTTIACSNYIIKGCLFIRFCSHHVNVRKLLLSLLELFDCQLLTSCVVLSLKHPVWVGLYCSALSIMMLIHVALHFLECSSSAHANWRTTHFKYWPNIKRIMKTTLHQTAVMTFTTEWPGGLICVIVLEFHCVLSVLPWLCQVLSERWITEQRGYKAVIPELSEITLQDMTAQHTDTVKGYLYSFC